jgi:hypothetical protein
MYDFRAALFEKFKGTDTDYILICKNNDNGDDWAYSRVPHEDYWETIDEAIKWNFDHGWTIVEVYDLYAEWHKSLVRIIKKVKDLN